MNTRTAIILGGHSNHVVLTEKLKARGYYTILLDYLDHPPAAAVADEHVQISTFDTDAVRDFAAQRHADLIINCCLEHLNKGIAKIAEELGLPMMYSYETALDVSDKKRMKKIMRDNGIPTTPFIYADRSTPLEDVQLQYPLFVKPADGSGSTGVNRVETPEGLRRYAEIAMESSRSGEIIIEQEAKGKECNVYCVIQNGKATVLTLSEKYSEIGGDGKVTKAIGSIWPANVSSAAMRAIRDAAQRIADVFRLRTTPMFMQLMVDGDSINIIEFACRMAGGYSYWNILKKLKFDYFDFTIDAFEGKETLVRIEDDGLQCAIHSLYAKPCTFGRIEGLDALREAGVISEFLTLREEGAQITGVSANRSKIGFFIVRAESLDAVLKKIRYVFDHIDAYDIDGERVLRKDVCLSADLIKEQR